MLKLPVAVQNIYDILTHLTLYSSNHIKIRNRVLLDDAGEVSRDWMKLKQVVISKQKAYPCRKRKKPSHMQLIFLEEHLRKC